MASRLDRFLHGDELAQRDGDWLGIINEGEQWWYPFDKEDDDGHHIHEASKIDQDDDDDDGRWIKEPSLASPRPHGGKQSREETDGTLVDSHEDHLDGALDDHRKVAAANNYHKARAQSRDMSQATARPSSKQQQPTNSEPLSNNRQTTLPRHRQSSLIVQPTPPPPSLPLRLQQQPPASLSFSQRMYWHCVRTLGLSRRWCRAFYLFGTEHVDVNEKKN
jgi:hypothetical protein